MALQPGDIFASRYRIDQHLGAGGFGDVYLVTDLKTQQVAALKVLKINDHQSRARFAREVAVVARLQSPHTVRVLDSGVTADGTHFAAFEYIPGRDLDEVLHEHGPLPPDIVEHVVRQLLASLDEAHGHQLLHRDLKPANIRVSTVDGDPWGVRLLDFGIARATDGGHPKLTATGELVGTPRYMSPEQLTEQPLTPASDIYSLGMVAFEMLAGPDAMQGGTWGEQLDRLRTGYLPNVSSVGTAGVLGEVILSMMRRDPAKRPAGVDEVLAMLDGERPTAPVHAPTVAAEPAPSKRDARTPRWVVPVGLVVALVGVLFLTNNVPKPSERKPQQRENPLAAAQPEAKELPVEADSVPSPEEFPALSGCGQQAPFTGFGKLPDVLYADSWASYIPRSYEANRRHPLVMLLHDDGQNGETLLEGSGFQALADQRGFVVVAPSSDWTNAWEGDNDNAVLANVVHETSEALCIDMTRVFVVGQGTGGHTVHEVSCEDVIRAGATNGYTLGGGIEDDCETKPLIAVNATESVFWPASGGPNCRGSVRISTDEFDLGQRRLRRCEGDESTWFASKHGSCKTWSCEPDYVSCVVQGGGAWPGTQDGRLNPRCKPNPASKFETTERVWAFFEGLDNLGCGVAPRFRGEGKLTAPDLEAWNVYVPKGAGSAPMPMLMLLHQAGEDPQELLREPEFVGLAERHGIVLLAPNGGATPWTDETAVESLSDIAQETTKQLCIDKTRQFVVGTGQGRAVERLACQSWVDGIATGHGSESEPLCARAIPRLAVDSQPTAEAMWTFFRDR